jgi:hypothetical protein
MIEDLFEPARTIASTLLVALGTIAAAQTNGTEATTQAITQLLNYCATHPNATMRHVASEVHLQVHSERSLLLSANLQKADQATSRPISSIPNDNTY